MRIPAIFLLALSLASPALATDATTPTPTVDGPGVLESSSGLLPGARSTSCPDTVQLYGGPGTHIGKFQDPNGVLPDEQGWTGVDLTDQFNPWQIDTFNSPTGNAAAWCGRSAAQEPGWSSSPGYGNNWDAILLYESAAVPNPLAGETVSLDFVFNHDTEPGYDFFLVEYDSAGTWVTVYTRDGNNQDTNGVYQPLTYSALSTTPITYTGGDFGGNSGEQVRIRLRVASDGAWSDQDGLWPSNGAVQVDDIVVSSSAGNSSTDFSSGFGDWERDKAAFAGDFFKLFPSATDLDPCYGNGSPIATFIDDGSPVSNPDAIPYYGTNTTGGSTSLTWSYGVPGGWVVNYNGGLSNGQTALNNETWSPPIAWDLPGSCDDGPEWVGATFAFDVYAHLVLLHGMFYTWHIRFSTDGGVGWTEWRDANFVYYSTNPRWLRSRQDVTPFVEPGTTHAQLSLGVTDLAALFGWVGADPTPSPYFDNVALSKYRIGGPSISARTIDLFQDSFPSGGGIDASTEPARDLLDIRVDMARDVSTGELQNIPGDSIVVDIATVIPGSSLDLPGTRMEWVLDRNPLFDGVRVMPAGATAVASGAANGWDQWRGAVLASPSTTPDGTPVTGRYFFDLPDANFLYPGDVLRYYVAAVDDAARLSTLPADIGGFEDGSGYPRTFTVRGLPSLRQPAGQVLQPRILLINDFGRRGGEASYLWALNQLGFREGLEFDGYTVQGPSSGVSNGIGGRANADQLGGYGCILYVSGNLAEFNLSNGTNNGINDKGDDVGVIQAWHDLPGARSAAFFGDGLAASLASDGGTSGNAFLQNILSVNVNDDNVRDEIGGQVAPRTVADHPSFLTSYVANGGCPGINRFTSMSPLGAATAGHRWTAAGSGNSYGGIAASVVHDRLESGDRKVDMTFAHGLLYVEDDVNDPDGNPLSMRAQLLDEVLGFFGGHAAGPVVTPAELPVLHSSASLEPSPFNPVTTIRWRNGTASRNRVVVYDTRGREVAILLDEDRPAGPQSLRWDVRDATGGGLASGVYLFEVVADDRRVVRKGVLLK